jgi:hypothetical protein
VTVRNGKVPSLKLNANLMKLARFNDLGPAKDDPSSFNLITTDLELANQRISSRVIDIDGYGVDVDGSGSVSVSGSDDLDYRGLAEITTKEGFFRQLESVVQHDAQERSIDLKTAIVLDETKLSEFVHEKIDPRPRRADHLRQRFLGYFG